MTKKKLKQDEIDYMHPDGKPFVGDDRPIRRKALLQSIEELVRSYRSGSAHTQSVREADGHHICSASCQSHHTIEPKGADKTV